MKTMVLDIGGTALKSAVFNSKTNALEEIRECPSEGHLGGKHIVELVIKTIHDYTKTADFSTIGISTAGQVNPEDGSIIYANQNVPGYTGIALGSIVQQEFHKTADFSTIGISTAGQVNPEDGSIIYANQNVPGYTGIALGSIVQQEFHIPTYVENDVNAASIGEAYFGAGRNEKNFVCLAYGTGIGGALYMNGSLYHGSSYSAGEFGAVITHPEDRHPEEDLFSGCYEKYASTTALVKKAMEYDHALTNGRLIFSRLDDPKIQEIIGGWIMECYEKYASTTALVKKAMEYDHALTNGRLIFSRLDDPKIQEIIGGWIMEIVYGLVTITHTMNPSCIILGGGVLEQPYVLDQLKKKFYEHIMPSFRHVEIRRAELGNKAGLYGAAMLVNDRFS